MKADTKLDLHLAAAQLVGETMAVEDGPDLDVQVATRFKELGGDAADYQIFRASFSQTRSQFRQLSTQPTPSAARAKLDAQRAALKAKTGPQPIIPSTIVP